MNIIAWPFGKLLWLCYIVLKNYGIALFVFTLLIKLIMLPSSVKQQKSMAKMQRLNPKLEQIKKRYANNKEKLNEATMELYNQENVNPMGSCLPMLVTFVLLFAVIDVVYAPLTHISGIEADKIESATTIVSDYYTASYALKKDTDEAFGGDGITVSELLGAEVDVKEKLMSYEDVAKLGEDRVAAIAENLIANPGLDEYFTDTTKVSDKLVSGGKSARTELLVLSVARDYPALFDTEVASFCEEFDYTFLGVYLGAYPSWSSVLVLIPILSLISQLAVTVVSQYYNKKNGTASTNSGMNAMLYIMPLFSFWIAFSFPAGLGIYWIFSSVLQLVQIVGLNLYFTPARTEKILEKEKKNAKNKRPSLYQQMLEQQKAQLAEMNGGKAPEKNALTELDDEAKLSRAERKELERLRINEARAKIEDEFGDDYSAEDIEKIKAARRRIAEEYGDDYKED
ncbi:MAG: membrane protein insertase YidC [Oscillospiraceae bacterium]|nr:membrane protein insertase YidC [Oscillospiraceae bacterium]